MRANYALSDTELRWASSVLINLYLSREARSPD